MCIYNAYNGVTFKIENIMVFKKTTTGNVKCKILLFLNNKIKSNKQCTGKWKQDVYKRQDSKCLDKKCFIIFKENLVKRTYENKMHQR